MSNELQEVVPDQTLLIAVTLKLDELSSNFEANVRDRTTTKLNNLYKGNILLTKETSTYINLLQEVLTDNKKKVMSLGNKFHKQPKFDPIVKQFECEVLYGSILKLEERDIVELCENLKPQLM